MNTNLFDKTQEGDGTRTGTASGRRHIGTPTDGIAGPAKNYLGCEVNGHFAFGQHLGWRRVRDIVVGPVLMTVLASCGSSESATGTAQPGTGGNGESPHVAGEGGGAAQGGASSQQGGDSLGGSGATGTAQGGAAPVSQVADLGDQCPSPGALACAGTLQKVSLICDGSMEWALAAVCGDGEFCDSTAGPNGGSCRPVLPECADQEPGSTFCVDTHELHECGPDLVTSSFLAVCDTSCADGGCTACAPWTNRCENGQAQVCDPSGTAWSNTSCRLPWWECDGDRCISVLIELRG